MISAVDIKLKNMKVFLFIIGLQTLWTSTLLKAQSTKDILTKFTKDYFDSYNDCNVEKMLDYCTDDIEVYHDLVGLINGKTELKVQSKKFCDWLATSDAPNVKAEIIGDLNIQELKTKADNTYGAIVTGTIDFIAVNKQTSTRTKSGTSDFIWILRLTGDKWQIARDVSYNHQDTSGKK
jgi:ketosteroid isomerase-like protein